MRSEERSKSNNSEEHQVFDVWKDDDSKKYPCQHNAVDQVMIAASALVIKYGRQEGRSHPMK